MKKAKIAIVILSALGGVIIFMLLLQLPKEATHISKAKEITIEAALKEIPDINISPEEIAFMQSLRQDSDVKAALEMGGSTELSIEKAAEIAAGVLGADIKVSEFSVIYENIYFGYYLNDYRVILEVFQDNGIRKTIGVYAKDGNVKTVYENLDNETFTKTKL